MPQQLSLLEDTQIDRNLRAAATRNIYFRQKKFSLEFLPYVYQGPSNQRDFIEHLCDLQIKGLSSLGDKASSEDLQRMAFIRSIRSGETALPTSGGEFEASKHIENHWNVNYFSHGWHRYVGRFPPQVVRSVLNYFGATENTHVLDPFVGSGTTSVECTLLGIPSVGVEICPLSSMIARVKSYPSYNVDELEVATLNFGRRYDALWKQKSSALKSETRGEILALATNLIPDFPNIEKWLTRQALLGLSVAIEALATMTARHVREFFLCAISASMRSIGNVDVDVVRAEYSRIPRPTVDVKVVILKKVRLYVAAIRAAIHIGCYPARCRPRIIKGDARMIHLPQEQFSYVITSPPYGIESISYLRTHLLSYRVLAHFLKEDPYDFGKNMIGSEYFDEAELPDDVSGQIPSPEARAFFAQFRRSEDSLRKRALQMAHFFIDMHTVASRIHGWLKPNGRVCFVIGDKKIGTHVIPTRSIIEELFRGAGFNHDTSVKHKLKCNNTNAQTPWEARAIQDEHMMFFTKK